VPCSVVTFPAPTVAPPSQTSHPVLASTAGADAKPNAVLLVGLGAIGNIEPERTCAQCVCVCAAALKHEQPGTVLGTQEQPGTVLGTNEQPGTVLSTHEQPGTVLGTHEQPGTVLGTHDACT
jgi:hypothetical protein